MNCRSVQLQRFVFICKRVLKQVVGLFIIIGCLGMLFTNTLYSNTYDESSAPRECSVSYKHIVVASAYQGRYLIKNIAHKIQFVHEKSNYNEKRIL